MNVFLLMNYVRRKGEEERVEREACCSLQIAEAHNTSNIRVLVSIFQCFNNDNYYSNEPLFFTTVSTQLLCMLLLYLVYSFSLSLSFIHSFFLSSSFPPVDLLFTFDNSVLDGVAEKSLASYADDDDGHEDEDNLLLSSFLSLSPSSLRSSFAPPPPPPLPPPLSFSLSPNIIHQ